MNKKIAGWLEAVINKATKQAYRQFWCVNCVGSAPPDRDSVPVYEGEDIVPGPDGSCWNCGKRP